MQKLASFGNTTDFNHMDPNSAAAQNMYGAAQGYGAGAERPMGPPGAGAGGASYPHQRQMVRPPAPQTGTAQYPYQPDNMYSMPDHQLGMTDAAAAAMQGWGQHTSYPMHRYGQMTGNKKDNNTEFY